ncbi:secreted RxLR effector protein 161-like [Nicotiana tomentosiformis]|uniref:secreted RxLR effector protein 161-like n=1 Tax=Nicotiana tomentosiformis TaxID=4098 RepID=UPI00388C7DF3
MGVRSLEVNKDPFRPPKEDDELFGPEIPYLSAIGALMYLANATRPHISFSVNLLARYSSSPIWGYWNEIKHILRYLKETLDMSLFYANKDSANIVGYADACYLSDSHKSRSQTGYVFICGVNVISLCPTKQSIVSTFSNHAEIIAIHEAKDYPFGTPLKFIYKQLMQAGCKQLNAMICSNFLLNRSYID